MKIAVGAVLNAENVQILLSNNVFLFPSCAG